MMLTRGRSTDKRRWRSRGQSSKCLARESGWNEGQVELYYLPKSRHCRIIIVQTISVSIDYRLPILKFQIVGSPKSVSQTVIQSKLILSRLQADKLLAGLKFIIKGSMLSRNDNAVVDGYQFKRSVGGAEVVLYLDPQFVARKARSQCYRWTKTWSSR